jgi:hypothetical protein
MDYSFKGDTPKYIKVCGILTLILLVLCIAIAWFNTGDLYTALHDFGTTILVIIVGLWLALNPHDTAKYIGTTMVAVGFIYLIMGRLS